MVCNNDREKCERKVGDGESFVRTRKWQMCSGRTSYLLRLHKHNIIQTYCNHKILQFLIKIGKNIMYHLYSSMFLHK